MGDTHGVALSQGRNAAHVGDDLVPSLGRKVGDDVRETALGVDDTGEAVRAFIVGFRMAGEFHDIAHPWLLAWGFLAFGPYQC